MSKKIIIFTILSIGLVLFGIVLTIMGIMRISVQHEERGFSSDILGTQKVSMVYLPPAYELEFGKRYPVLYLLDGQRFFHQQKEQIRYDWSIKKTLDRLIKEEQIPKIIVIGIYADEHRLDHYTAMFNPSQNAGGDIEHYAHFITSEYKPFIDSKYRTLTDSEHTAIAGLGLGGLAALTIGFEHDRTFQKIGALSPALWWEGEEESSLSYLDNLIGQLNNTNQRIWLDAFDGDEDMLLDSKDFDLSQALYDIKGKMEKIGISAHVVLPNDYDEASLDQRLADMLKYLFGSDF